MKYNLDYLNEQHKLSGKNAPYNFTNLSNDVFYIPTESSQNYPNKRRLTTASYRKNRFDKEQTGFPNVYTSGCPHNTANLYLNKKNFSFKKKLNNKGNNYYDKEKLYQKMMKLQTTLNNMNLKYHKQKMENDKQAKEIEKQNQFLNLINSQNMRNMDLLESYYFKNENNETKQDKNDNLIRNLMRDNANSMDLNFIKLDDKKFNLKSINNSNKTFTENSLRRLYDELYEECKSREKLLINMEKDKEKYTRENGILKVANETLISNLKCHMKQLEKENEEKDNQIKELKKNLKCSRYTELLKENEVLNQEMEKLKNKLRNALILINDYKKQEEEIKKLYEVIKKKDFKIKALELELTTLSNNSDEITKKLKNDITKKDKLIKQQERDFKKSAFEKYSMLHGYNQTDRYTSDNSDNNKNKTKKKEIDRKNIYKKYPELYLFYLEMKHKSINNSKDFENEVLKKIKDTISIKDAKIEYVNLAWSYFNISDDDKIAKEIIVNFANKEFINHRNIYEIKKKQINILDILFNKKIESKTNEEIKNYIDTNSLEELIKRTFMETDINKLGYISYDEMKKVINESNLVDFIEEILIMTKSEIFNRFDYYNFLILFNENENEERKGEEKTDIGNNNNNIINKEESKGKENSNNNNNDNIQSSKNEEHKTENNENNDNNEEIKENEKESTEKKGESDENKDKNEKNSQNEEPQTNENKDNINEGDNNNSNNNKNINNEEKEEKEEKDQKSDKNILENKLILIVHKIKKEGATPVNYFSQIKENVNINNQEVEVINLTKLKEFLSAKEIELNEEEIKLLKEEFGFKNETNTEDYINNENFVQKLLNIIQNDSDNDDDFMNNIPKMDFADEPKN